MEERLQKIIAGAGLCSRRTAEEWIAAGRVEVNGRPAALGDRADPERDSIRVDGAPLPGRAAPCYLMLNKPRGYTCSLSDPHASRLVTELVAGCGARVYPVGRLDVDSQGLLLLTNDGEFTQRILHPSKLADKVYHVQVSGFREESVPVLSSITDLEGERISPALVRLLRRNGNKAELEIIIHEGRKRQIRRMCRKAGLTVERLRRVAEHGLPLGGLPGGEWRDLTEEEVPALERE